MKDDVDDCNTSKVLKSLETGYELTNHVMGELECSSPISPHSMENDINKYPPSISDTENVSSVICRISNNNTLTERSNLIDAFDMIDDNHRPIIQKSEDINSISQSNFPPTENDSDIFSSKIFNSNNNTSFSFTSDSQHLSSSSTSYSTPSLSTNTTFLKSNKYSPYPRPRHKRSYSIINTMNKDNKRVLASLLER